MTKGFVQVDTERVRGGRAPIEVALEVAEEGSNRQRMKSPIL